MKCRFRSLPFSQKSIRKCRLLGTVSLGLNARLEPRMKNYMADFQCSFLKSSLAAIPPLCERKCEKRTQSYRIVFEQAYIMAMRRCIQSRDHFIEGRELDEAVKTAYRWYYVIDSSFVLPYILKSFLAVDALYLALFLSCWYQTIGRPELAKDVHSELQKQLLQNSFYDNWFRDFDSDCDHLFDSFHYALCYSALDEGDKPPSLTDEKALAPTNTIELKKAGIRLKPDAIPHIHQTGFKETLWDDGPVLLIPRLWISDQTEPLIWNLVVLGMVSCPCCRKVRPRRSTITSPPSSQSKEDVELMRKHGIVISFLRSNGEMIEMLNTLCKYFSLYQSSQWTDMLTGFATSYETTKYEYYAKCRAKYFERPWTLASSLEGVCPVWIDELANTPLQISINNLPELFQLLSL